MSAAPASASARRASGEVRREAERRDRRRPSRRRPARQPARAGARARSSRSSPWRGARRPTARRRGAPVHPAPPNSSAKAGKSAIGIPKNMAIMSTLYVPTQLRAAYRVAEALDDPAQARSLCPGRRGHGPHEPERDERDAERRRRRSGRSAAGREPRSARPRPPARPPSRGSRGRSRARSRPISSSRSTSRGISASSGGRWIPSSPAIAAPTTKRTHTRGSQSQELRASTPAQTREQELGQLDEPAAVEGIRERAADEGGDEQRPELGQAHEPDRQRRARELVRPGTAGRRT